MGNSTVSLRSGINHRDNSIISNENTSIIYDNINSENENTSKLYDIINTEEEQLNLIYIRNKIKKEYEESKNNNNDIGANNKKNNLTIPTMFEWSFKGKSVYLTGSFCNWNEFFLMKKDENGIFRLVLDLKKGFHQYKFKIDNEWRYNKNFPTINDNGFINNYIDTSNWEIKGEYENEEINHNEFSTSEMDLINYMIEKDLNLKLTEDFYKANVNYCNYKPLKNELFNIPPQLPYQCILDCIDKNFKNNEDKENLINHLEKYKINKSNNKNNNKYKDIKTENNNMLIYCNKFVHEQVNHIHLKKIIKNRPIKNSIFSRLRLKFTTFIYYK